MFQHPRRDGAMHLVFVLCKWPVLTITTTVRMILMCNSLDGQNKEALRLVASIQVNAIISKRVAGLNAQIPYHFA